MAGVRKPKKPSVDYVAKVQALDRAGLLALWTQIGERKTPGWAKGKAFEHLVLRAFELEEAEVTWPYSVLLEGQIVEQIDGLVRIGHISFLAESKDFDGDLNVEPLAKLRNQLLRRPVNVVGCVFSSSGSTAPAKTLAQYMSPQTMLLWHGAEVGFLLEKEQSFIQALHRKHHWLIRAGIPDYNILTDV